MARKASVAEQHEAGVAEAMEAFGGELPEYVTTDGANEDATAFVTDYDANGEAVDTPVTPPSEDQPQGEMMPERELEMHDGKIVREHRVAFGGRVDISLGWPNERAFWEDLRVGKTIQATVNFEVGDDSYRKMTDEGVVIGLRRVRKLNAFSIHFQPAETDFDGLPLFDMAGGEYKKEQDPGEFYNPDEECFCAHAFKRHAAFPEGETLLACSACDCIDFDALDTPMRREPEEPSALSEALAEARA